MPNAKGILDEQHAQTVREDAGEESKDEPNKPLEEIPADVIEKSIRRLISSMDKPTSFAHPGVRVAYTLVVWFILGYKPESGKGFFIGLGMFSVSLFLDYVKAIPRDKGRLRFRQFEIGWSVLLIIISFFGLLNILTVISSQTKSNLMVQIHNWSFWNGVTFPLNWLYLSIIISIILTIIDWAVERPPFEKTFAEDATLDFENL